MSDMSGTVLGSGDKAMNKVDQSPCSHPAYILVGEADNK